MNFKWMIVIAVVALGLFAWDMSCKARAGGIVDDVYLNIGVEPDGNSLVFLKTAARRIRSCSSYMLLFGKIPVGKAADLIENQKSSLEYTIDRLRENTEVSGVQRDLTKTYRNLYSEGIPSFKRDLEYIRRGF